MEVKNVQVTLRNEFFVQTFNQKHVQSMAGGGIGHLVCVHKLDAIHNHDALALEDVLIPDPILEAPYAHVQMVEDVK